MSRVAVDWSSTRLINYKEFRKNHPHIDITFQEWKNIIRTFNDEFKFYILETGEKIKLPFGFGEFSIQKKKRKQYKGKNGEYINLPVDWVKTKEMGKIIYNFNFNTEGYFFGWKWFRPRSNFNYSDLWYFKPARITSRIIAHYIKSDPRCMDLYKEWGTMSKT